MTLLVIGTDCIGSCKSNYHAIMTMMAPNLDMIIAYLMTVSSFCEFKSQKPNIIVLLQYNLSTNSSCSLISISMQVSLTFDPDFI
jgi:hypothetical protein